METIFQSLKGKNVLITGSSRGIGRALAEGFLQNGANMALHGTKKSAAMDEALEKFSCYEGTRTAVYGDLACPDVPEKLVSQTVEKLGGIDILISNASIQIRKPWLQITDEEMEQQTQVNFFGTIRLIQRAVPYMLEKRWGRIVTIGSVQQEKPHPEMLIYSANKSAVRNVVQSLAMQLAPENITVNNIAVGTIYTDRNSEVLKDVAYFERVRNDIPLKCIGEPSDCVGTVLMLSSNAGRYITGENIHIDGGKFI